MSILRRRLMIYNQIISGVEFKYNKLQIQKSNREKTTLKDSVIAIKTFLKANRCKQKSSDSIKLETLVLCSVAQGHS